MTGINFFYILRAMKKKTTTIDDLARMVKKGFDGTSSKTDLITTKIEMKKGFAEINKRLDRIENLILIDHKRRIERLEFEVKELKELLAVK